MHPKKRKQTGAISVEAKKKKDALEELNETCPEILGCSLSTGLKSYKSSRINTTRPCSRHLAYRTSNGVVQLLLNIY